MSFIRDLADKVRERATAPALQRQVLPQVTPLPRQIGGIGSVLPTQTITLPNGQTVQIPQINMEEINANLLAAGIAPQVTQPIQPRRDYSGIPSPDPKYETFEDYMNRPEEEVIAERMPSGMGLGLGEMMTAKELIARGGTPQPRGSGIFGKGTPTQSMPMPSQPMPSMPSLPSVTLPTLPTLGSRPGLRRMPMMDDPRER